MSTLYPTWFTHRIVIILLRCSLCLLFFHSLPLLGQVLPRDLTINTYEQPAKATATITIKNGLSVPPGKTFIGEIVSPIPPLPLEASTLRVSSNLDIYIGEKATLSASADPLTGNAFYLDGINDFISLGQVSKYSFDRSNSFTLEAWIRTRSTATQTIFANMLGSGNLRGYNLLMTAGKVSAQLINTNSSNYLQETTENTFHDGSWHHVAWSYNGNSNVSGSEIYVDGVKQTTTTVVNTLSATTIDANAIASIGARNNSSFFNGAIDEVRIWNIVRSENEISSGYTQMVDPATSGLIGYYRFDEPLDNSTASDQISPQAHGVLYNGPIRSKATHEYLIRARTFSWSLVSNATVLSSTHTLEIGPFTTGNETHTYRVSSPGYGTTIETADVEVHVLNPHDAITSTPGGSSSYNYITTNTVLVKGITSESELTNSLSVDKMSQQTTYFDGLGRPMQVVTRQASPELYDLVQPIAYDALGREVKKYLPYVNTMGASGAFQDNAITAQNVFYNGQINPPIVGLKNDGPAYSETLFEASPLNRVLEQGAPGTDWQIDIEEGESTGLGNTIKIRERTNEADEVRKWEYTFDDEDTQAENDACAKSTGYYDLIAGEGELFVAETEDENRNLVREYKDKQGRLVCKKVQDGVSAGAPTFAETYYVYDDFGYLRFVVPPQAVVNVSLENYRLEYGNSFCKKWLFAYLYDAKGRMSEKIVPGAEPVYMVYNGRDELILTQDGRQRQQEGYKEDDGSTIRPRDEWSFIKYDALGRVVMTGLLKQGSTTEVTQAAMQAIVDTYEAEGKDTPATTDDNYLFEELSTATGSIEGYSSRAFPATVGTAGTETLYGEAQLEILSVNYYDSYDKAPATVDLSYEAPTTDFEVEESDFIRGKATVSKVCVLYSRNPVQWLYTVSYYDDKSRVIQVAYSNHTGGIDRISSRYDFAGKVMETITVHHNELDPTREELIVKERSVYDHMGRVMESYQRIGNQREERLSKIEYNALGELITKKVGVKNVQEEPLQEINFDYNIRGWLTKINDLTQTLSNTQTSKLFAMELGYTREGNNRQYNGNITSMEWKTGSDNVQRKYEYQYDEMNRITHGLYSNNATSGTYFGEDFSLGNSTQAGMSYDKNGNILSMKRYGFISQAQGYGMIDNLDYNTATAYNGNQLQGVIDNSETQGQGDDFDYLHQGVDYIYDKAGNMEEDKNKDIYAHYNHLNLPSRIEFTGNRYILYRYDATGRKLEKQVYENDDLKKQTHYLGQFFYEDEVEAAQLQFVSTSEGRALDPSGVGGEQFAYEYNYKDHLGNLRVSFRQGETYQYEAGMEAYRALEENLMFANVSTTLASDGTARTGKQSSRLNSAKVLGPWKTIRVTKGDVITATAHAFYKDEATQSTNVQLIGYIGNPNAPNNPANSGGTESGNYLPTLSLGLGISPSPSKSPTDKVPNAYLKYIFYDDDKQPVEADEEPVTEDARFPNGWEELSFTYTAKKDGYLQVMVANESQVQVYFDDILIIQEKGLISQENHYDPFGLNLTGIEKQGQPNDKWQYNGIEKQVEFGLNWELSSFRSYDSQLGRWHQIDAIDKEDSSPYAWVTNNPVLYSDPFGLDSLRSTDKDFNWNNVKPGDTVDGTVVLDEVTVNPDKTDLSWNFPEKGEQVYDPRSGFWDSADQLWSGNREWNGFEVDSDGRATGQMKPNIGEPFLPVSIGRVQLFFKAEDLFVKLNGAYRAKVGFTQILDASGKAISNSRIVAATEVLGSRYFTAIPPKVVNTALNTSRGTDWAARILKTAQEKPESGLMTNPGPKSAWQKFKEIMAIIGQIE